MKVLILTCNTGEGHNTAAKAIEEYLTKHGHDAVVLGFMKLAGERHDRRVSRSYILSTKYAPHIFHLFYKAGAILSSPDRKSPVYYSNAGMAKYLYKYLEEHPDFDILVTTHLYAGETLTYMKRKGMLKQSIVSVQTDYTWSPFWEETLCDAFVIPHEELTENFTSKGIPKDKIYPFGIPVREEFYNNIGKKKARKILKLPEDKPVYLIMGGSMGFGKIRRFTRQLAKGCNSGEHIMVICGTNDFLKKTLKRDFKDNRNIHIIGFTRKVSLYMEACDVVYTKPGGLSSTEVIIKNRPLIHTAPIPGCEIDNLKFFVPRGISAAPGKISEQIECGRQFVNDKQLREQMLAAQRQYAKREAAAEISNLLEQMSVNS
ncbi:MGDG synthase family glycosyltransferase [Anaerocolumna xylanovorans]|uniref:Monogalactosyldiacylglycerol synthase n=1 Tax=Anaerocolumna xylanovorans DSM 12503 TaxID=1121345 RepID=A0A1M7YMX5_9FIRM|nr:glycosyltransferase [Anaerocolumna xylanovorans]SHO54011.1 Monogalactosyldiacylglycerol synthase [Anaerocolumna xylanovorans DSM 12503]